MLFGGLKDGLRAQAAWTNYEPILRELVTTVGSQMFRDRFRAQCMDGADKEERRLMYHFSKARFDWRWEILEVTSGDLADRWPILKRYADWENAMLWVTSQMWASNTYAALWPMAPPICLRSN